MPDWRQQIRASLTNLNANPAREAEIIEEISQHLNDRYQELLNRGATEESAYQTVMEEFNGGKLAAELRSLTHWKPGLEAEGQDKSQFAEIWQNLRYAARLLQFNPGFASVMILSLALGIGANTAIFQLLNAVRLRSLPVLKPQELATIKIVKAPKGRKGQFTGSNPQLTNGIW
ncbi:MAG TPA: permease prefix domain 1-containing protein, partial [Acidobacteriota bacterium]